MGETDVAVPASADRYRVARRQLHPSLWLAVGADGSAMAALERWELPPGKTGGMAPDVVALLGLMDVEPGAER